MDLLENPNYRKFLRLSFPWIGHLGICHSFMLPLIGAAKHCRSAFVELRSELNPWNTNPWLRPLISRNKESLTMKLESFILSIFKYARPDLRITDSDWCQEYFENRQFIGIYGIFEDNKDFFMSVKVRVKFCGNRSGKIPIMGSDVKIELSFEEIVDGKVSRKA